MNLSQSVRDRLVDFPLELHDILKACVEAAGLFEVMTALGALFGNSGQLRKRRARCGP